MNLIQLHTPLPLRIVGGFKSDGQEWKGPTGNCMAVGWCSQHQDHHISWIVFMDTGPHAGECYTVENPWIRARSNWTWGRYVPKAPDPSYGDGCS